MKNLEHTIRDMMNKKTEMSGLEFLSLMKNLEEEFIKYLNENNLLEESVSDDQYDQLAQKFLDENVVRLAQAAIPVIQKSGGKVIDFLSAAAKRARSPSTPKPSEKPGEVVPFPKKQPETPAPSKPPETPAPSKPAETPSTPAKPSKEPLDKPAKTEPAPTTTPGPKTDAKPSSTPKETPKPSGSGGKLGAVGTAIAAVAGYKLLKNALRGLLNPGSGGGGSGGISTYGNQGQLHQANPPTRIESVERTAVEYVGRPKPKLKKLRKALGKEYPIGKQGSVKTKIIDEATEKFIEKAKKAKEKDHSKVTETETVAKAKYNHESPDGKYY